MQIPTALQSAAQGLQRYDWQMAQAAAQIARFGDSVDPAALSPAPGAAPASATPSAPVPQSSVDVVTEDLSGTMLMMLMAQRAYRAQIRIFSVAEEMQKDATSLGGQEAA